MTVATRKHLKEHGAHPLREGLGARQGQRREITIIRAGWGASGYYSEEVLRRDGHIFGPGTKMYIDHPTRTEETDRPERSVTDLAATIVEPPRMAGIDLVSVCEVKKHWVETIDEIAADIGLSIRAWGEDEWGDAGGRSGPIVTSLLEAQSVDFVTEPGAGGKVGRMIEESRARTPLQEKLASEIRDGLSSAGKERWGSRDTYVYLEDYDHDEAIAIFCVSPEGSETYYLKCSYTEKDGECVLTGEPEEVERETRYVGAGGSSGGGSGYSESMPAHLKEARNVAHWFEAGIHRHFTEVADNHFGQGYITREERIALSQALGDGLTAFNASVDESVPHLLDRDIYERPENPGTTVSENDRSGGSNQGGPDMGNADGLSELTERFEQHKKDTESRLKEAEDRASKAETRADRAEDNLQLIEAGKVINRVVADVEGLPDRAQERIIESALSRGVPTTSDGQLDRGVLEERARAEIHAEQEYLAGLNGSGGNGGTGRVRGVSESSTTRATDEDGESALEKVFQRRGLSEGASKAAAAGRVG